MNMNVYILIVRYIAIANCIREQYLQYAMYTHPCIEKLYSLFCSKPTTVIGNVACNLYQAFKIRKYLLNILCVYVYGPVVLNTIKELNWIDSSLVRSIVIIYFTGICNTLCEFCFFLSYFFHLSPSVQNFKLKKIKPITCVKITWKIHDFYTFLQCSKLSRIKYLTDLP